MFLDHELESDLECLYCGGTKVSKENPHCANCKFLHEKHPQYKTWVEYHYDDDCNLVPANAELYSKIVHLSLLDSLDDPNHFGHPIFKVCQYFSASDLPSKKDGKESTGEGAKESVQEDKAPGSKKIDTV